MRDTFRAKVSVGNVLVEVEGSEQFVRDELAFLKQTLIQKLSPTGLATAVPPMQAGKESAPGEKLPIKQYVEGKSIRNDMEKATIVAYYAATYENSGEIDGDTLSSWFTKAGWKPPKTPTDTLRDAKRRKGYLDAVGSGEYRISDTGRYFVEHEWGEATRAAPGQGNQS